MEIKSIGGVVLWSGEAESLKRAAEKAVAELKNLDGASLGGANLDEKTVLWTGETWKEYLEDVLPALLSAGGRTVEQIIKSGAWECHTWKNCPMAEAFGVHDENDCPKLLLPRVRQFVQLFDAGLIPCPAVKAAA